MSETTPPWRAFSSEATDPAVATSGTDARRPLPGWVVPALVGVGSLGLGLAVVALVAVAAMSLGTGDDALPVPDTPGVSTDRGFAMADPAVVTEPAATVEIVVDVAGAVVRPGLHRLRPGDRVGDAIEAAGGFAPRADLAASAVALNLAQPLEDGAKVLVPELGTARPSGSGGADDGRIDLNHASQSELESLPGIGPVTAGKIIESRSGERFDTVGELRSRGLVGEKVYEDIKGLVRAG